MARKTIRIKRIEDATSRQVTFYKRRRGLLKKAHDLSVLCDAQVGLIIFSSKGKLFEFAKPSMESILERYKRSCADSGHPDNHRATHVDVDRVTEFTEKLRSFQSNLIGDDLKELSIRDLIHLERLIHESLGCIRAKKAERFLDPLEDIKEKVKAMQKKGNMMMMLKAGEGSRTCTSGGLWMDLNEMPNAMP